MNLHCHNLSLFRPPSQKDVRTSNYFWFLLFQLKTIFIFLPNKSLPPSITWVDPIYEYTYRQCAIFNSHIKLFFTFLYMNQHHLMHIIIHNYNYVILEYKTYYTQRWNQELGFGVRHSHIYRVKENFILVAKFKQV